MNKKYILVLLAGLISSMLSAQEIAQIKVFTGDFERLDCPVSLNSDEINFNFLTNQDSVTLVLYEVMESGMRRMKCQQENGSCSRLWFILDGRTPKHTTRTFILKTEKKEKRNAPGMRIVKTTSDIILKRKNRNILAYRYQIMPPPPGVDTLYAKSGFIHPLWSPEGEILTRIQPRDHYHHYGIWGPWTKTHIEGREVDFWNLVRGEGTVRFSGFLTLDEGSVYCGFKARQEHIDFGATEGNLTALNEILEVRAWNVNKDAWLIDYTTTQNCPLETGILLDAYRYGGGIGFRATEKWTKNNSSVLSSEGKDRKTADGTKARWCRIEGASVKGRSGILFMDAPGNRNFPEPMRVWPLDANNGRGDLFFEFCPIRHESWKFERGKSYVMKYRMYVFDGVLSKSEAEMIWQGFAHPPKVLIKVTN